MWQPHYTIRPKLLRIIRQIGEVLGTIRAGQLGGGKLAKLSLEARALSTHASTSIEGNPLRLTDVKRVLRQAPAQLLDTEREIVNYNRALQWIEFEVRDGKFSFNVKTFAKVQKFVVDGLMENPTDIGKLRQRPVVIRDPRTTDGVVFIPPDAKDVPKLLDELFAFVSQHLNEFDPVLLAGLFHKQAVIIHPFMDGNGRATRLMTTALLGMTGLDIFPIFSFENYYNRHVAKYFRFVGEHGDFYDSQGQYDFTDWLEYFAEGILDELQRVQKTLPATAPRLEPHLQVVLQHLADHGSINQREYGAISHRSLAARKLDFARLVKLGRIQPVGSGRSRYYVLADSD